MIFSTRSATAGKKNSHLLSIVQFLHEAGVLLHPRNAKRLSLGTNGIDKIVIGYGCCADCTLDARGISKCDSFFGTLR